TRFSRDWSSDVCSSDLTFDGDLRSQLRGGVGLFMGEAPNVWISGAYQNTGLNYIEYTATNSAGIGPIFSPDPDNQPTTGSVGGRQNVDIIAPGVKQPSVWKANLAFDQELPWYGLVASAELLLTEVKHGLYLQRS